MRVAAVLLVVVALPAAAQPPDKLDPAREHYEKGLAKYNLADFDAAIAEFKASYELSNAPRLLFNIAQAYRLKKDYERALYFYNSYLRAEPNPPNLSDVEQKIDEMQKALDAEKAAAAARPPPPPPPAPVVVARPVPPPPPVDRRPSRRTLRIAGAVTGGLGLLLAVGGATSLGLAAADASTLRRVARTNMPWTAADDSIYRAGERSQLAAIVMFSVGGAAVVAGAITLVAAHRRR